MTERLADPGFTVAPTVSLPCYSAAGTAFMLRGIINRGALQSGDLEAIHAACVLLERAAAEGRI